MINTNDSQSPVAVLALSGQPLPVDLEFKPIQITEVFEKQGLHMGRCFGSKSGYANTHPKRDFISNANVFSRRDGKVWWGDLDLERDKPALETIAWRLRCRLYVLGEFEGRFENATRSHAEIVRNAVWHTGGLTPIPGVGQFLRRSGLSHTEAAILLKVSRRRFNRPQQPKMALEIVRRIKKFEEVFAPIASDAGHKKWGLWWTRPSKRLAGKSPLKVLRSGETLDLGKVSKPTIGLMLFALWYGVVDRL